MTVLKIERLPHNKFLPEYKKYGRSAPLKRNLTIIENADLVLACTDDPELNGEIYSVCKCLGIPVNVCSDRRKCDFYFPGIVARDNVVIGVTAGGTDHRKAREVREKIERLLEEEEHE